MIEAGFGMNMWGLIGMIVFWGLLAGAAIWLVRWLFPAAAQSDEETKSSASAEEVLMRRYMHGELTEEQYQQMLQTLRK